MLAIALNSNSLENLPKAIKTKPQKKVTRDNFEKELPEYIKDKVLKKVGYSENQLSDGDALT